MSRKARAPNEQAKNLSFIECLPGSKERPTAATQIFRSGKKLFKYGNNVKI